MSQAAQVIALAGSPIYKEAITAAGSAVKAGDLIELDSAGKVQEHSTAAGNAAKMFADTNLPVGGGIDDEYAAGDTCRYGVYKSGDEVNALVADSAPAIAIGDALESAGDGTLVKAVADAATDTAQRDAIVGYALEALTNATGSDARLRIQVA